MRSIFLLTMLAACSSPAHQPIDAPPRPVDAANDGAIDGLGCVTHAWYADCDGDGFASPGAATTTACTAPAPSTCGGGWTMTVPAAGTSDCNDARADIHPGATEVCDGVDNNCNGVIDENGLTTFYQDADGDGHGNPNISMLTCMAPSGYVPIGDDCNDLRADVYPGATEVCDGVDNNCNNLVDENVQITYYRDADGDGHGNASLTTTACSAPSGYVTSSDDCNDGNYYVHPGLAETCDGLDNDCNGLIDDGVLITYYRDADSDGYGNPNVTTTGCSAPGGYVSDKTDCNDSVNTTHPGAPELCFNAVDDNCNGLQDEEAQCSMDCNWSGARWLSHGWDGGNMAAIGVWATCLNSKLNYMHSVYTSNPGNNTYVIPTASGTSDNVVGCNWGAANRWASQGWDGGYAFTRGAELACDGTRVTTMTWELDLLANGQTPVVTSGQLGCDWNGAIYLTHGRDGNPCAWYTGFFVTCSNSHITNFEATETAACARQRN